jgi:iron complex outermembrane receptor protein
VDHYSRIPSHCPSVGGREDPASRDESEDLPERILLKELSGIKVMFKRYLTYIIPFAPCYIKTAALSVSLSLLFLQVTSGQDIFTDDTINISAVTVTAASSERNTPFSITRIDSATLASYVNSDLATLLQKSSLLSVKRYGTNGLASVSMRGLSGSHTQVSWNGINITSPGPGMSDFAIIPVMAASSVVITPGGSDLRYISGSIGGRVELISDPSVADGTTAALNLGAGSFGSYASSLLLRTGNDIISANLSLWGDKSRNNFIFINSDDPSGPSQERRTNSASASAGIISDLFLKLRKSALSAHLWLNDAERELPGPVITVQQDFGEKQRDRSARGVVKYSLSPGRFSADIVAGESCELNSYTNESAGISGENKSIVYTIKGAFGFRINDSFELTINAGDEYQRAESLSFAEAMTRNLFSTSLGARYSPVTRLRLTLHARQMIISGMTVDPEMTAGGSFLLTRDGKNIIRAGFSRNSKIPSMNDLFWVPGGNTGLIPEISTGGEAAYSFSAITPSGRHNSIDISFHSSSVDNLIQWVPGPSGIWTAENVRNVSVTGVEAKTAQTLPMEHGSFRTSLNYALTRSLIHSSELQNDKSIGKQLIYTPLHHANVTAEFTWRFLNAGATAVWESKRYTTSDNSEWLPQSFLADADLGAKFAAGRSEIAVDLRVKNIFNTQTECVQNYPMPLRTYLINLKMTFGNIEINSKK